jgi:hypothetical protein
LSVIAVPICSVAQSKIATKTACELVTKADVESTLGEAFEGPVGQPIAEGFSSCEFRRPGLNSRRIILVLAIGRPDMANPDWPNVSRAEQKNRFKDQGRFNVTDVQGVGDDAYWAYNPEFGRVSRGVLHVFQSGRIELQIQSWALRDEAAELEKVKKLAIVALGGPGKTGYVYAQPGQAPPKTASQQRPAIVRPHRGPLWNWGMSMCRLTRDKDNPRPFPGMEALYWLHNVPPTTPSGTETCEYFNSCTFDQFAARLTDTEWRAAEQYVPAPMSPENPKTDRQPYFRVESEVQRYCADRLLKAHNLPGLKPF